MASRFRHFVQHCDLVISPRTIILVQKGAPSVKLPEYHVETCKTIYCYDLCSTESSEVVVHSRIYIMTFQISLTDKATSSEGKARLGNKI